MIHRILREPLLHFLLAGAALFVLAGWDSTGGDTDPRQIVLTDGDLEQLRIAMLAQGMPEPDADRMRGMVDAKVREEILYREAIAMGLDQDDTIIRRRLAQKMDFLAEDLSALREPTQGELIEWMKAHPQDFALPPRITFRHLYFSPDAHGANTRELAAAVRRKLDSPGTDEAERVGLGDRFMYQDYYAESTPAQVGDIFGRAFASAAFELKPDTWSEPIESGLGWHLVFVESMTPGRSPELEEVEADVRLQWQESRRKEFRAEAYRVMQAKYEVILPPSLSMERVAPAAASGNRGD